MQPFPLGEDQFGWYPAARFNPQGLSFCDLLEAQKKAAPIMKPPPIRSILTLAVPLKRAAIFWQSTLRVQSLRQLIKFL